MDQNDSLLGSLFKMIGYAFLAWLGLALCGVLCWVVMGLIIWIF